MMTTRHEIVRIALGYNGNCNGQGYDGPNPFSADLSHPAEAWCGDYVTDVYQRAQIRRAHGATRNSWEADHGDIVLFDWNGDGIADHTEIVTGYRDGALFTIGGNSGPSNIDSFNGDGGVHRHRWPAPAGIGNNDVLVVIDASKVVAFGGPAHPTRPGTPPPVEPRLLMLKSPMMRGADVRVVQHALNQRNNAGLATDGVYGSSTRDAVLDWQRREHIEVDGIVGPQTRSSLGLPE